MKLAWRKGLSQYGPAAAGLLAVTAGLGVFYSKAPVSANRTEISGSAETQVQQVLAPQSESHVLSPSLLGTPTPLGSVETRNPADLLNEASMFQRKPATDAAQSRRKTGIVEYNVVKGYEILDAQTFGDETATFELADIQTPPPLAICRDEDGGLWACGLQARANLNNLLKKIPTLCRGMRFQSTVATGHCTNAEGDVAAQLVSLGFARSNGKTHVYDAAESEARAAKRGLWRNNWQIHNR